MLLKLVWRNLWRNRSRTLITGASVMFAVILSVLIESLQTGVFDNLVNNVVGYYSSYIQVHAKGYFDEQTLDNTLTASEELIERIETHPNVQKASQRIETFVLASGIDNTRGCMVTGIEPEKEKVLIQLHQKVVRGNYIQTEDRGILMGDELARMLDLGVNDTVVLLGQGFHGITAAGKYPIRGILHFGSPELNEKVLFMPLRLCREFLDMTNQSTTIALALHRPKKLNATRDELGEICGPSYEVITWEEMMPDIVEHMKSDKASGKIVSFILYLLVCFGIFSTLLMMMAERQFEFGMLMAIGMKKSQLAKVMVLESVFITLAGSLMGALLSIPVVWYLKINPIRFSGEFAAIYQRYGFEPIIPTSTDPMIFMNQTLTIVVLSLILSLYTLFKIYSLDPVNAMKR